MASSSSSNSPCAACKFLRRKCQPECAFAPYFPPDQPQKFQNVHRIFGASNVAKLLNELHPQQREDAVNSLAYEAETRLRDPVNGCLGVITQLNHQLRQLQMDLYCAKSELWRYQNLRNGGGLIAADTAAAAAAIGHHHHHTQNLGGDGNGRDHHYHHQIQNIGGGSRRDRDRDRNHCFYHHHQQLFQRDQQYQHQMVRNYDGGNNNNHYDGSVLAMNINISASIGQLNQLQQQHGAAGGDDRRTVNPS